MVTLLGLAAAYFILAMLLPESVYAYLDAGTGSFILQFVLGIVLGSLVTIRMFWKQIKDSLRFFKSQKRERKPSELNEL